MDENTATAIAAICAAIVSIATVIGQVMLSRRMGEVKRQVDTQAKAVVHLVDVVEHANGHPIGGTRADLSER